MINIHVRIQKTCAVETTGRCHRVDNESIKFQATPGYVLCWNDILIISVGHFGYVKKNHGKCGENYLMDYQSPTSRMQCREMCLSSCGVTSTFPKTQR